MHNLDYLPKIKRLARKPDRSPTLSIEGLFFPYFHFCKLRNYIPFYSVVHYIDKSQIMYHYIRYNFTQCINVLCKLLSEIIINFECYCMHSKNCIRQIQNKGKLIRIFRMPNFIDTHSAVPEIEKKDSICPFILRS